MSLNIRELRYFVETVRLGSFTYAASALFVTQSTISKMVRQLEEEIGQPLLIRDGRRVVPTDAGRIVYERGLQALEVVRELQREVTDVAELSRGELTVGMPPMGNLFFPRVVSAFRRSYPKVELRLAEYGGRVLEQKIASGELEVAATILFEDDEMDQFTREVVARDAIWAVGPPDVFWSGQPEVLFSALDDQPLILLEDGSALTRRLRVAFRESGVEPRVVAQSGHWEFLAALAAAGVGTTFLPERFLKRIDLSGVSVSRMVAPKLVWTLTNIWSRDRYLSHAARAWLAVCTEILD